MRRTLIQFDDETYHLLRERAFRMERSMSSVVRELVADGLRSGLPGRRRPRRARGFASVNAGRSTDHPRAPVSEHHDAAVADAFDS
jgi:hypothetical protein